MHLDHADWKICLKILFHQTENSFHHREYLEWEKYRQKISFHKQELPPTNFKSFNKALNKKYSFHQTENPFALAGMKHSLKKTFPFDGKSSFHSHEYLINEKKLFFTSQKNSFYEEQRKFFFKNWPPRLVNGFHKQKTLNKGILFHLHKKRFYSFCFCQCKLLLKLGRINF